MRIGFDAKRATHNFRGLGNYSRGIIEGLYKYSPDTEISLFTPQFKNKRIEKWISDHSRLEINYPQSILGKLLPAFWRSFLLENELKKAQIDIYHGLSHELPRLKKRNTFKTVVTIHDLIFMRFPDNFPWIDRKIYYQKFKYAVDNADLVIAICEQTKKDIVSFLKVPEEKIQIHYQSASPIFYDKRSSKDIAAIKNKYQLKCDYILHVGAFEKNKNQLNVLKSFANIKDEFNVDLVFVGSGKSYLEMIKHEIINLKLESRVHILNQLSFDELPCLYQGSSLLCFPSFFEGFGIPIVEALFSEVPVVTSQGFCFPESAGPNSVYCDPSDVQLISNSIRQVLGNPDMQKIMRTEGLKYAQRFTLESTTQKLVDIYNLLICNKL